MARLFCCVKTFLFSSPLRAGHFGFQKVDLFGNFPKGFTHVLAGYLFNHSVPLLRAVAP